MSVSDKTAIFDFGQQAPKNIQETMELVYAALEEKGYNPIKLLVIWCLVIQPTFPVCMMPVT